MTMPGYSAGTAWLQVIPSLRHIDRRLARDVNRLAGEIDRGLREAVPESIRRGVADSARDVDREGRRLGDRFGGTFASSLRRQVDRAMRSLGQNEIGPARNLFDQQLRDARAEIEEIRDQHIRLEIDDDEALRRLTAVRQRIRELERRSGDRATTVNLRSAGQDIDAFLGLAQEARRSGDEAGGNFGGAFGRAAREHLAALSQTLPDIPIEADSSRFNLVLQNIRREIAQLREFRIGIDGDSTEFFRRVAAVEARLARLRRQDVDIPINFDLDRASATLRQFMERVAPEMGRAGGERTSGRFADELNRRITGALRDLPAFELRADSTQAQHEIHRIRTEMRSIRDLHIRGELDTRQVMTRLAVLQARLREMARNDVDIQVRADTAAAAIQLAAIAALMNTLDGQVAGIGRAANSSLGRLGAIIAAALSLGTILVPAAAGSAVAIGGIATAATAAAAGVGVLILAMSGVVQGITALHKYQQDVDKSAKSVSQSQTAMANAIDGVSTAERNLANTRESVALGARRAAQAVVDAQRAVADAVRDRRRAELDLVEAIKEAKRQDEDRAMQLRGNALDQRQSVLDIADAKAELDAVLANPQATEREREEARITYEQRILQMDRLKLEGKRLAEEEEKSRKLGIQGNDRVVAAQERVRAATQRVADAQERVADAVAAQAEQQRQGAQQIASATQQLVSAQRSAQQAFINTGVSGGEALDNLQDAFRSLSPEAQRFIRYLYSMKDAAVAIRQAAERGMLPGFQQALRELQPYLPGFEGFVFRVAEGLGWIAVQAVRSLQHPVWRQFFGFINQTAVPSLKGMYQFSESVARGLAALIMALSPFNRPMGRGLLDMAEGFARWAEELDESSGYVRFLNYVAREGPRVIDFLGEFAELMKRIVLAAAPIGSVVLQIFRGLFTIINEIPLPILTLLLAYIGGLSVRLLANAAVMGILTRAMALQNNQQILWNRLQQIGTGIATTYAGAVARAAAAHGTLNAAQRIGAGSMGVMSAAARGFIGFLGGPWGIAITAAVIGIGYLVTRTSNARRNIQQLQSGMEGLASTFKGGVTPAAIENAEALLRQDKKLRDLVKQTSSAGITTETLVRGLNGEKVAREQVLSVLDAQLEALEREERAARMRRGGAEESDRLQKQIDSLRALRDAFDKTAGATADATDLTRKFAQEQQEIAAKSGQALIQSLLFVRQTLTGTSLTADSYRSVLDRLGDTAVTAADKAAVLAYVSDQIGASTLTGADKVDLFNDILEQLGSTSDTSGPVFDALAGTFNNIARSSLSARDKVDLLRQAIDQMYGASIQQYEADLNLVRTQQQLAVQLNTNKYGFDLTKAATGAHTEAIIANIEALKTHLASSREKYLQDIANGVAEDKARAEHEKRTKAIQNQIDPLNRNSAAVQDLINRYGAIPPHKSTQVTTPGLDKAILELVTAHAIQIGLAQKPQWTHDQIDAEIKYLTNMINGKAGTIAMFKAEGGPIPGYSPHRHADNIGPLYATAGEFMQPVDAVDYYGVGSMEAIRRKLVPRELLQGFAIGGRVPGVPGYATGGFIGQRWSKEDAARWPIEIKPTLQIPDIDALWAQWEANRQAAFYSGGDFGPGPGFPPWPSSPGASRGDSGVWRSIVNLIRSTGPLSGSFGNAYRHGDPLWHGCVPMDTLVLTRRGWVTFDDVVVGVDETVGYNPATGRSQWTRIVGMHHYEDAPLWTLTDGQGWSAEVTPEHRWLTADGRMVESRDLDDTSRIRIATVLDEAVVGEPLAATTRLFDWEITVEGIRRVGERRAEVFCPSTELGTWTARQGSQVFLTGNSGRAVDWMGYNQDALATFLANHRPLELIHRTSRRDYAYTRGQNRGSFNNQLMQDHRNHIHIAMREGGLVGALGHWVMDQGGWLETGWNPPIYNGTSGPEAVLSPSQWRSIDLMVRQNASGPRTVNNFTFRDTTLTPGKLRAMNDAEAAYARVGRAR